MALSRRFFLIGASATLVASAAKDLHTLTQVNTATFLSPSDALRLVWGLDITADPSEDPRPI